MAETVLRIRGMTCGHCRDTVTKALKAVPGVQEATVDLAAGTAYVVYDGDRADDTALARSVEATGYEVEGRPQATRPGKGCCC